MTLGDIILRNAALLADKPAIVFEGATLTYAAFADRACRLANALLARGVRRQDRVAILAQNRPEYLEVYGAGELAGFITAALNYRLAAPEMAAILDDCSPGVFVFEAQYADTVAALRGLLKVRPRFLCIGAAPEWAESYEAALESAPAGEPVVRARPDDVAYLIYTSGTTGRPKGVMLGHAGQIEMARQISAEAGAQPDDRLLLVMPLYHIGAKCKQLAYSWRGATAHLHRSYSPAAVCEAFERDRITATHLAPVMLQGILDAPEAARSEHWSLRTINYAAAPIPATHLARAIEKFGSIFVQFYGMTETGALGTTLQKHDHVQGDGTRLRRLSSAGQPSPGCAVRIVDAEGRDCPTGAIGEVVIRSPAQMLGYWNNHAATIDACRDGWMHTGDAGAFDEDGYLSILDRKKDMIVSGGENIYPREVEDALASHPEVGEVAVIGVPDERWGESVKAFVVLRPGARAAEDALVEHCRTLIAGYKKPKSIDLVEEMPRLPSGKIDKKRLREPYWRDRPRQV